MPLGDMIPKLDIVAATQEAGQLVFFKISV
jgi:hypothetical protein